MGADLYINSLYDKNRKKYEKKFNDACRKRDEAKTEKEKEKCQKQVSKYYDAMFSEGYFRDSYNATSVLWALDMSWWGNKYIDENGVMSAGAALDFLKDVKAAKLKLPTLEQLKENYADVSNGVRPWHTYYRRKKKDLIEFLKKAVELQEDIHCSV